MKEKIKDTIVDLLFDGVKEKLDCVKENYKWQKLFVSTGDFFVNNPDVLVKFEDDLYSVFSKDNLIRIAKRLKDNNGYDFSQLLHNELYDLMVSYEIPIMETETYIHHFMQVIITYLEENDSDKALEMFLGDMRKEIGTYFAALESKLELVLNQISNLNKEKITTYSIADIDAQIRRETKYKGMGLDFFKLDDEQFESKFQNSLNDTKVYVVGKSREETTYRILNELKNKNSKRITLVVKSEKEWNKLQHSNLSGNILVPFFYADSIVVIPNNTNIFIYGEDEPCYTQNKLVLRKRTKRNIIDSLEELGIDANEAYKMVDNTHGLYVPLKKKLFDGAMYDKPDWIEGHSDVVIAALLCGKWTEATGDVLVFEELSGKAYSDCKKELGKYLHRENPYIVSNNSYRGSNMQLASVEDAWEELDLYINDEMWDKFISLFYEVLIESEPIFEYPFEKHFEASIYAKKPEWSPTLKKGMIRTLIMRAYYRGHEENQKQIDNIVAKVLDTITSKERWGYISQYLPELCEASPESVLRKLESEIEVSQGLIDLFAEKDGDFMTSRHLYIFSHVYDFPLLNPIPYSKEENTEIHNQNYILREEEINERIKKFKEKGYSIDRLIQLAVKEKYDVVGEVLAQFYCDGLFDEKVFCSLMENDKEGKYVYDYVSYLYRKGIVDLSEVIEKVKSISDNKNLLTNLISLELVENYENALIVKENEDIKKMYWSRNGRLRISDKAEHGVFIWAINECKKYGSFNTYLELLYDIKDKISVQELYKATLEISDIKSDVASSMTDYYLKEIHERNGAHRDIKPENLLILDDRLVLSDFGLYWGIEEERLTEFNERIGPYKIMPPELENVQTDLDLDFRPSDVYLFAKVLWMTLKGDNIGFRGQYQRGDVQIFLNKEVFGDVITLEPIHKLIEQATFEDMNKRISIHQCIDYLELQRNLLDERERELLSNELVSRLLYDEHSKMIIERTKPDELIYEDKGTIFSMLRGVIPISKIMVKSLNDEQKAKQVQLTDFQVGSGGICKMLYFNNGIKVKEYIMEINKMIYSNLNLDIVLELNDIDSVDKEYVAYSETVRGFGNMYPKIYFSSDEKIIITKVK